MTVSTSPIKDVLRRLRNVRQHGNRPGWECQCPAHDDRHSSLGLKVGDDGRVLMHCQAGCPVEAIVAAIGLKMSDLFPPEEHNGNGRATNGHAANGGKARREIVATYDYADEAGVIRFQAVRYRPKGFSQRRALGSEWAWGLSAGAYRRRGSWGWSPIKDGETEAPGDRRLEAAPLLLYRLPELLVAPANQPVFVVEGEKDVEALLSLGLVATCNPMGAGKWKKSFAAWLRGRKVIVLPDNDPAGEAHAAEVMASLSGEAARAALLRLEGLPTKGDVSDWLAGGHTVEELLALAEGALRPGGGPARPAPGPALPRLAPFRPFPVEALPVPLARLTWEASDAMGCDPCYVALPALAVCAAAIGNSRSVQLKRGWSEPSVLWTVFVGESGTLKTPPFRLAMRPLYRAQKAHRLGHQKALARWRGEMEEWKEQRREDRGDEPQRPQMTRSHCSDITIEKLAEVLEDNPRGVLVARDELAGWLNSFSRYKSKGAGSDLPNWLELYQGGNITVDRKTGDRRLVVVEHACASITGGIQPGTLARALTPEYFEAGLAARLLPAWPPRRQKRWTEATVSEDTEATYENVVSRLLALSMLQRGEGDADREPHRLTLSADAKRQWVRWYDEWAGVQHQSEGDLVSAYAKIEAAAVRLALVHHVVTLVDLDTDDLRELMPASMEAGIILARWFAGEVDRIYTAFRETDEQRDLRRLIDWVARQDGRATAKQLQRANGSRYRTAEQARAALDALAQAGAGTWQPQPAGPQGGRPTEVFVLSPTPDQSDQTPFGARTGEPDQTPSSPDSTGPDTPDSLGF